MRLSGILLMLAWGTPLSAQTVVRSPAPDRVAVTVYRNPERGTQELNLGWLGGLVFLVALYVPAFLLLIGAVPFWDALRRRGDVQAAMAGVNASVVGLLLAALYDPVWTSAIHARADFGLGLAAFWLLVHGRVPPFVVVALSALAGWLLALV